MLIQTNTDTVVMVLDSMHVHNFCGQSLAGEKHYFGADVSSPVHVDNKKRYFSSPTQGLDNTTIKL